MWKRVQIAGEHAVLRVLLFLTISANLALGWIDRLLGKDGRRK